MIRKALWLPAATAVLAAFITGASAQERVVNVYNWSDYIDQSILEDFTKETGIKVVYDVFDSNEILETKLLAGGTGYDVVVPTANFLAAPDRGRRVPEARQVEAAQPVQYVGRDRTSASPNTIPATNTPSTICGARSASATTSNKMKEALGTDRIDSWDVVFKPEIAAKLTGLRHSYARFPTDIMPTALNYLGLDPDSQVAG